MSNHPAFDAVVAGHVCLDLTPALACPPPLDPGALTEVGPMALRPGGCVGNTGTALAALGVSTRLVADVGDDAMGSLLAGLLARAGADSSGVRPVPGQATSYSVVVEPPGRDRCFWHHPGANAAFDGSHLDPAGARLVHLGYPTLLPALARDKGRALADVLQRIKAAGATTSLDFSTLDPASAAAAEDWPALLQAVLPLADIVTPSADDLASLGLGSDPQVLVELGAAVALVTDGPRGMALATADADRLRAGGAALSALAADWADARFSAPAPAVEIVSTTGAGDAAAAGLLAAVLNGLGPHRALDAATAAAAHRVSGRILQGEPC